MELRAAGINVTGEQQVLLGYKGHFIAKPDGFGRGIIEAPKTSHILEFKTINDKGYKALCKDGVRKAKPEYYAQVQIEMHLAGTTRTLFIAVNKNDDSIYTERIRIDADYVKGIDEKIRMIIDSATPPAMCQSHECNWCDYKDLCQAVEKNEIPPRPYANCRTCAHSTPIDHGEWHCASCDNVIPHEFQCNGCDTHLFIPGIIGEVQDTDGETYVLYENGVLNFNDDYAGKIDHTESWTANVPF